MVIITANLTSTTTFTTIADLTTTSTIINTTNCTTFVVELQNVT